MQAAAISGKKADHLQCMSEALSNYLTGMMALELQRHMFTDPKYKGESAAVEKVLIKHGYKDKDIMGYLQLVDSPLPGGAFPGFMQIGDVVKDKPVFMDEADAALKAIKLKAVEVEGVKFEEPPKPKAEDFPKLTNVKITGDRAVADAVGKDGEKQPMPFVKENGSWKVAASEPEPDWKKPIQGRFLFQDKK